MVSILRRIILLLKIWLAKLFESAEDPREVFAAAHRRQQALLARVLNARNSVIESRNLLAGRVEEMRDSLLRLEQRARDALSDGREDSARLVLYRRQAAVEQNTQLEQQVSQLDHEEHALGLVEGRLSSQIETYFAHKETLAARYDAAAARAQISEALSDVSPEFADLGQALERAEEQTEQMLARAEAIDELTELGILRLPGQSGDLMQTDLISSSDDSTEAVERMLSEMRREGALQRQLTE